MLRRTIRKPLCAFAALAAAATITATTAPTATADVHTDIVGGHPATERYGWPVSLQVAKPGDPDFHRCTATLRGTRSVRVNAHCVTKPDGSALDPALFHLRAGSNFRRSGGFVSGVAKVIQVPIWHWGKTDDQGRMGDDAVLITTVDLPVQAVEVDPDGADPGEEVRELGWGRTDPSDTGPAAEVLQELDTTLAEPMRCNDPELPLAVGEICVDNAHGVAGACSGDSGGPLAHQVNGRWQDLGGASRNVGPTPGCGGSPTIYTDVSYWQPWEMAVLRGEDPVKAMRYLDDQLTVAAPARLPLPHGGSDTWAQQWALAG